MQKSEFLRVHPKMQKSEFLWIHPKTQKSEFLWVHPKMQKYDFLWVCPIIRPVKSENCIFTHRRKDRIWFLRTMNKFRRSLCVLDGKRGIDVNVFCIAGDVKVVNQSGRPKSSLKLSSELHFDFTVENLVVLQDSVLAFHKHGMQGRSFRTNEVG